MPTVENVSCGTKLEFVFVIYITANARVSQLKYQ